MSTLDLQCFVSGVSWLKSAKCIRIDLDVKEMEFPKYGKIMSMIEQHVLVQFTPSMEGKPKEQINATSEAGPEMMTEPQRKKMWALFSEEAILEVYGVRKPEDVKNIIKERLHIEHMNELTKGHATTIIEALNKDLENAKK